MGKGIFGALGQKVSNKMKVKATEMYEKASPKVQKELDKVLAMKGQDIARNVISVASVGAILYFIFKPVVSTGDEDARENFISINEVNITINNYLKGD